MRKIILGFLILLSGDAFSQKGFLGKRNQIEWDAFSLINQGKLSFEYRFLIASPFQITFIYKYTDLSNLVPLRSMHYAAIGSGYTNSYDVSAKGLFQYNASTFGLGFVFASSYTNMPLPFGYYTGLAYERTNGNYIEMLNPVTSSSSFNYSKLKNPFEGAFKLNYINTSNLIKVTYGKCSYLGHNLSLDLSLDLGFVFGRFYGQDTVSRYIAPSDLPDNTNVLGLIRKTGFNQSKTRYDNIIQTDPVYFSYFRLYGMPKIKMGFLF